MAIKELKLEPIKDAAVMEVVCLFPDFIVQFENYTQCLVTPSKTLGSKRLYPFAKEIVGKWGFVSQQGDLVIVAKLLVFQILYEEQAIPGVSTLYCIYRGMVS